MTDRTALVTGAGRGIGRAVVEMLLDRGWRVAAAVRDPDRAREGYGERDGLAIVRMDVRDREQIRAGAAEAEAHAGGPLHLLVNNAGYAAMGAQEDADLDQVREMFETNVFGAAEVVQAVLPGMRGAGRGVVVTVGSVADILPTPLMGFYNASKAALTAMSHAMAVEVRPFGIRVAVVAPGMVDTDFPRGTVASGSAVAEDGVYRPLLVSLRAGFSRWRADCQVSAEAVAEAVAWAAEDPDAPFRIRVGKDTEALTRRRAVEDDRRWQDGMVELLGSDWGRGAG